MTKCWVRAAWALLLVICILGLISCGSSSSQQQGGGGGGGGSQDNHQDSAASVTLSPNSGAAGSTLTVTITGNLTNFIQGQTTASFGPGTTVASGADAAFTNVTVNSPSSATAQVAISANAAAGPRFIVVATGGHNSAATFFVTNPGVPVANAGPNQQVVVGATVHLDGSGSTNSGGAPLTYAWSFLSTPSGSAAALSTSSAVNPTFTADKTGDYLIKLTVTDSASSKSTSAAVLVSTALAPPLANAGPNQVVVTNNPVQLDGSGSTDTSGNTLTYSWKLSSPSGSDATSKLSNASNVTPSFTPDADGNWVAQLTVNDGKGNNSSAAVTISAATSPSVGSVPPLANAGLNQKVASGSTVQLDASGSHFVAVSGENGSATAGVSTSAASGSSGDPLKYAWSFTSLPSGSQAALSDPNAVNPTFQADQGDATYALQLTVTDDNNKSSTSAVLISTDNLPPIANAGPAQYVAPNTAVTLDGTGSTDLNNQALNYSWVLLTRPAGSSASLQGANTANPTFTADSAGSYVAQLIVSDGFASSAPSTVLIVVTSAILTVNPTAVNFPDTTVGSTTTDQAITLTNTGTADLSVLGVSITGANAGDFNWTGPQGSFTVPANGTPPTLNVTFTPSSAGSRTANLVLTYNAQGPHSIALNGNGKAGTIGLSGVQGFGNQLLSTASAPQTITVTNNSNSTLPIAVVVSGANFGDFKTTPLGSSTLAPAASTTFTVSFAPTAVGARSATLTVSTSGGGVQPATAQLTGSGVTVGVSPTTLPFGNQAPNTTSAPQTVTVSNPGSAPLSITSVVFTGTNPSDFGSAPSASVGNPVIVPAGGNQAFSVTFKPPQVGARSATMSITANVAGVAVTVPSVAVSGFGGTAAIGVSPSSLPFPNQPVGTSSTPLNVTVSNTGTAPLSVTNIAVSGTNASDFSASPTGAQNPALNVDPGKTTIIQVTFTPSASGARSATLTITSNGGAPQNVSLSGTGTAPGFSAPRPACLDFGSQLVGSATAACALVITNNGNVDLTISNIAITGANAGDFSSVPTGAQNLVVHAGNSTTVNVTFKPIAVGARTAAVTFTDNASGSPQSVALTGTGVAPVFSSNSPVDFGSQQVGTTTPAKAVTLTNTGTAPLTITSITLGGTNAPDFAYSPSAPGMPQTVQPNASFTFNMTFKPSVAGGEQATLTVADNASGSPQTIQLSGTGTVAGISCGTTCSLAFGNQLINTASSALTATITNTGQAPLTISNIAVTGANAAEFVPTPTGAQNIVVPAAQSTTISVVFTPTATGTRSATLALTNNVPNGSPFNISLSGTGTAPGISVSPNSIPFGNQQVGTTSAATSVTVTNTGTATLAITTVPISGANAGDFAATPTATSIAPGANTTVSVTFTPSATGTRTATLTINSNAGGTAPTVSLTGTGTAPGFSAPRPACLDFGNQQVGSTSAACTITITNNGTAPLAISNIAITGTNAGDFGVNPTGAQNISVQPNQTTTLQVTFKPTASGARSASVSITDNASGSPHTLALTGTGIAPVFGTFTPNPVTFPGTPVGTTSAAVQVTITNTGTAPMTVTSVTFTGTNATEFAAAPNSNINVAAGGNAVINVTFAPTATGNRTATMSLADNAAGSPHTVAVSGTGTQAGISISPNSLTFGNQPVGQASTAQPVTVTNTGTAPLTITGVPISGTNPGDFSAVPVANTVQPNSSTTVNVTFTPTAIGARGPATLTINSNAPGTAPTVSLSGTGTGVPVVSLSPNPLAFPGTTQLNTTSAPVTLTISNTGTGPLTITGLAIGGTNPADFAMSPAPSLPITVQPNANTTVNLTFTPSNSGARTATLNITDNAAGSPQALTLQGTGGQPIGNVIIPGNLANLSLGGNMEVQATAALSVAAPNNLTVTITSSDPSRVIVSNDSTGTTAGGATTTLQVAQGSGTLGVGGFYVQGLASSGSVILTIGAPGYVSGTATVTLTPSGFVLNSPAGQGQNFSTATGAVGSPMTASAARLDTSNNFVAVGKLRGGFTANVPISSGTPATGTISGSPAVVTGGTTTSANSVTFNPVAQGTSVLSAAAPAGFSTPATGASLTATVTKPALSLNPVTVGTNLQAHGSGTLLTTSSSNVTVTISSSDATKVILSADATGLTAGSSSIQLTIPAGTSAFPAFWVQGVGGTGASPITLTVTDNAGVYSQATAQVAVTPSGFVLTGPNGATSISTTTLSQSTKFTVTPWRLDPSFNQQAPGQLRGGITVNMPILNTNNPSVGTITGGAGKNPNIVTMLGGDTSSVSNNKNLAFVPGTTQGTSTISVDIGNITCSANCTPAFVAPATGSQLVATVTQPAIALSMANTVIGSNLQVNASGSLNVAAPSGGLNIRISSSDPNVVLSTSATTAGASSITVPIQPSGGLNGIGFPTFFVQALGATPVSGSSVTLTAHDLSSVFADGTIQVTLAPSGLGLLSSGVAGQSFSVSIQACNQFGNCPKLTVQTYQLDPAALTLGAVEAVRGGIPTGAVPFAVNLGTAGIGSVTGTQAIAAGSSSTTLNFNPLSVGSTTVTVPEPPGFITPVDTANPPDNLNTLTATVSQ